MGQAGAMLTAAAFIAALVPLGPRASAQQQAQLQFRAVQVEGVVLDVDMALLADPVQQANQAANQREVIRRAQFAQFEPELKAELSFANRACQWNEEERKRAVAAGKACLEAFLDGRANQAGQVIDRQVFIAVAGAPVAVDDPSTKFVGSLTEVLRLQMSDQQRGQFDAEREKRAAFRAETAIENIVSLIDLRLDLSSEQRDKIAGALRTNWKPGWAPPVQLLTQMGNFIPAVPAEHVVPFLTKQQVFAWNSVQKVAVGGNMFGQGVFGGGEQVIDDIDLNEAP